MCQPPTSISGFTGQPCVCDLGASFPLSRLRNHVFGRRRWHLWAFGRRRDRRLPSPLSLHVAVAAADGAAAGAAATAAAAAAATAIATSIPNRFMCDARFSPSLFRFSPSLFFLCDIIALARASGNPRRRFFFLCFRRGTPLWGTATGVGDESCGARDLQAVQRGGRVEAQPVVREQAVQVRQEGVRLSALARAD